MACQLRHVTIFGFYVSSHFNRLPVSGRGMVKTATNQNGYRSKVNV